MTTIEVESIKGLDPKYLYMIEISEDIDMEEMADVLAEAVKVVGVHFLLYDKGSLKIVPPGKGLKIVKE